MPRHADAQNLQQFQEVIEHNPGHTPGFFARLLKWQREKVNRGLVTLNDRGVLLYEDDQGQVWPCSDQNG